MKKTLKFALTFCLALSALFFPLQKMSFDAAAENVVRYEAEDASLTRCTAGTDSTQYANASQGAGVQAIDYTDSSVNFTIAPESAGKYTLSVCYFTTYSNATLLAETAENFLYSVSCNVRGTTVGESAWTWEISETTIDLREGSQVLSLKKGAERVRLDYIELEKIGDYKAQQPASPQDYVRYEAEDAEISPTSAVKSSVYSSGGEYVGNINTLTDYVSFKVTAPGAGKYELRLSYAIAGGFPNTGFDISVNGEYYTRVACWIKTGWGIFVPESITAAYVELASGENIVTLNNAQYCEIDYISVSPTPYGYSDEEEKTGKTIDMYLIGGQSNAVGYSTVSTGTADETFPNVIYAGQTDYNMFADKASSDSLTEYVSPVTSGLGRTTGYIGPEYGLAKALNSRYSQDNKAFIFKSAAGGTALLNRTNSGSATYGNWYPTSLGGSYIGAGRQFELFIQNFATVYNQLVADGYTPIIKGMAWFQGESDRGASEIYASLIKYFIHEIRYELSAVTNTDLTEMPFIIAEISPTWASAEEASLELNDTFNQMLHSLENSRDIENVHIVSAEGLLINGYDGTVLGSDQSHYNSADMVTLGERTAEVFMEVSPIEHKIAYDYDEEKGSVDMSLSSAETVTDEESLLVYVTASSEYTVTSVTFNGTPLSFNEELNRYELSSVTTDGIIKIEFAAVQNPPSDPSDEDSSDPSSTGDSSVTMSDSTTGAPQSEPSAPADSADPSGCGSSVGYASFAVLILLGGAILFRKN